jgi:hypothetical protein
MADEFRQRALESGQLSAGITTVKEISVLTGHRIERAELGEPGEFDRRSRYNAALISAGSIALNDALQR